MTTTMDVSAQSKVCLTRVGNCLMCVLVCHGYNTVDIIIAVKVFPFCYCRSDEK